jgi:hypothetical protein
MGENDQCEHLPERRSEKRQTIDRYYSVQFIVPGLDNVYQFKLWNISTRGMCILVREDSDVIGKLEISQIIDMTYCPADVKGSTEVLKTQVRHITRNDEGRFVGHCLIGLEILE